MIAAPTVHQALYGYEDGHRLLVSSTDMANLDQRLLLRQTDSPDAGRDGWKELLAGFPLPSGRFAWCLTWPAPEMPRPGCVWTHVLIFEPEIVAEVGLFSPRKTFRRPNGPKPDSNAYRKPLPLTMEPPSLPTGKGKLHDVLATVAWAFFDAPTRPVRIGRVALDEEPRHLLLMALWEEGWPELRRVMSLADAPYAVRELPDGPFDLQLQSSARRVNGADERVIDGLLEREPPRWARALASEALEPAGLVKFLFAYGPELPARRDSVMPLARLWLAWEDANPAQLLTHLEDVLPDPGEGHRMKSALLDPREPPVGCSPVVSETALLAALVAENGFAGVDLLGLRIPERVTTLLKDDPKDVRAILQAMRGTETPAGSLVLDGLCRSSSNSLKKWLEADPSGLAKVLRLRPAFAAHPAVARALDATELWAALRRVRGARARADIAVNIIRAGGKLDPLQVGESWTGSITPIVELLSESEVEREVLWKWVDAMETTNKVALAHKKDQRPALVLVLLERSESGELKKWKGNLLSERLREDPGPLGAARIFLAALEQPQRASWASLGVKAYEYLYGHATTKKLGPARSLLSGVAADGFQESHVEARLAKGLNRVLKRGRWPAGAALECEDQDAFQALIDADDHAGLARRVLAHVMEAGTAVPPWQVAALTRATAERADPAWVAEKFAKAVVVGVGKLLRL